MFSADIFTQNSEHLKYCVSNKILLTDLYFFFYIESIQNLGYLLHGDCLPLPALFAQACLFE